MALFLCSPRRLLYFCTGFLTRQEIRTGHEQYSLRHPYNHSLVNMSYNDNSRYEGGYSSKPFENNHPGDDHDGYSQGGGYKNERTKELQDELDQVQNIVNQNLGKVMERGEHLENLQGKADRLQNQTKIFNSSATSASRTMRWRNMKWRIIIALTIIIIIFRLG
ncbi:Vesicle membrane receptor protein (v-SNARE) [Coemansia erecta]|nr:Vesicle membrane receptor protein (v-SNARE) [Coemansia erecta]